MKSNRDKWIIVGAIILVVVVVGLLLFFASRKPKITALAPTATATPTVANQSTGQTIDDRFSNLNSDMTELQNDTSASDNELKL